MVLYGISGGVLAELERTHGFSDAPPGTVVRDVEFDAFRLAEIEYQSGTEWSGGSHEGMTLTVVVSGSFTEQVGDHTFVCRSSSVIYRPAETLYDAVCGRTGACCLVFSLDSAFADRFAHDVPDDRAVHVPGAAVDVLVREVIREARGGDPVGWELALTGLVLEVVAAVARQAPVEPELSGPWWLASVLDILHERFRDPIRIRDIADAVGVHPSHLARVFREHLGMGPSAYIRRLRAQWAEQHVARSTKSLAQIARDAGFADQSHFTRVFKQEIGITPARLRSSKA